VSWEFTDALAALTGPARNVRFGYNDDGGGDYDDDYDVKIDDNNIIIIFASATAHEICASFRWTTALTLQYFYR